MVQAAFYTICYFLLALLVEMGLNPALQNALPDGLRWLFVWRLFALAGLLAGMLRGEIPGMMIALAAAVVMGAATAPDYLGPAVVSFVFTAWLAGMLARQLLFLGFFSRFSVLFFLLTIESLVWSLVRKLFWSNLTLMLPWSSLLLTALLGALFYALAAPGLKRDLIEND